MTSGKPSTDGYSTAALSLIDLVWRSSEGHSRWAVDRVSVTTARATDYFARLWRR
jgi:hypothetical protein